MPRQQSLKHPMQMNDEEALMYLFHPKIVKAVKRHIQQQEKPKQRGKTQPMLTHQMNN